MFFLEVVQQYLKNEKNAVNRMYLNEMMIKSKRVQAAEDRFLKKEDSLDSYVATLADFNVEMQNQKYLFNRDTSTGFPADSPLFEPHHIKELLCCLMRKYDLSDNKGLVWGEHKYHENLLLRPTTLSLDNRNPELSMTESPELLMLGQKFEWNYRLEGKRNFEKYMVTFPLLVFHICRDLSEEFFVKAELHARRAKDTFRISRTVLVTDSLCEGFVPSLVGSNIDALFILRGKVTVGETEEITLRPDVAGRLDELIYKYLFTPLSETAQNVGDGVLVRL